MTSNSVSQLEIFKRQQEGADKATMMHLTKAPHAHGIHDIIIANLTTRIVDRFE